MLIIAKATAPQVRVLENLRALSASQLFIDHMFAALWEAAEEYGIDPVGMVAQSYHETGGGYFRGRVQGWFHNTAGIKVYNVAEVMRILGKADVAAS